MCLRKSTQMELCVILVNKTKDNNCSLPVIIDQYFKSSNLYFHPISVSGEFYLFFETKTQTLIVPLKFHDRPHLLRHRSVNLVSWCNCLLNYKAMYVFYIPVKYLVLGVAQASLPSIPINYVKMYYGN